MIIVNDVLQMYESLLVNGQALRQNLLMFIMCTLKEKISDENKFRVDFIRLVHDELYNEVVKDYKLFLDGNDNIVEHFYKCVSYLRLYEQIKAYQDLTLIIEKIDKGIFIFDENVMFELSEFDNFEKYIDLSYLSTTCELEEIEEEITLKLINIKEK